MVATFWGLSVLAVAFVAVAHYRMFLKAVERYGARVGDHDKVCEYAAAIRPPGRAEWLRALRGTRDDTGREPSS